MSLLFQLQVLIWSVPLVRPAIYLSLADRGFSLISLQQCSVCVVGTGWASSHGNIDVRDLLLNILYAANLYGIVGNSPSLPNATAATHAKESEPSYMVLEW